MASVILADCIGFVEIYGEFAEEFRKNGASCGRTESSAPTEYGGIEDFT